MTHESWRSELLDNGQELPSLFQYTKGLRIESIVIELGITAHVIGNRCLGEAREDSVSTAK